MQLYLASQSPRRQQLLDQIGVSYKLLKLEINEDWHGKENPKDYVIRMAREKAEAGKKLVNTEAIILAADTSVVLDNHILGKAHNKEEASEMLKQLSGRTHQVMSAVCVMTEKTEVKLNISQVHFKPLSENEINTYCETEEPIGKAGGYAIQGFAACFIERLEGSYSGVMGLPLYETRLLLERHLKPS